MDNGMVMPRLNARKDAGVSRRGFVGLPDGGAASAGIGAAGTGAVGAAPAVAAPAAGATSATLPPPSLPKYWDAYDVRERDDHESA
jgi:hypothetical protein